MSIHQRPVAPEFLVNARTMTVQEFFTPFNLGLFTPMMWPDFNWSQKQITHFIGGINTCAQAFVNNSSAIHYVGSIVIVEGFDPTECVKSINHYSMPTRVCTVVDGLNRLTAFAVVGCLLYQRFRTLRKILSEQEHNALRNRVDVLLELLLGTFSCGVQGATPQCKPILVHGRNEFWSDTEDGYRSPTASYFATALAALWNEEPVPSKLHSDAFSSLVTSVNTWLDDIATPSVSTSSLTVWQIRSGLHWLDPVLFTEGAIAIAAANPADPAFVDVGAFVKLFALTQTLLQRCCFTVVTPTTADASATFLASYDDLICYN